MTNRTPWTPAENKALVSLYFTMLDCATTGQTYSKAAMIRIAQGQPKADDPQQRGDTGAAVSASWDYVSQLRNRSRPSIEFKLMNATAAHADLIPGAETMDGHGYRAMPNYQATLKQAMADELARLAHRSQELTAHFAGRSA